MKKVILGFAIAIGMMSFAAFKVGTYEAKKNTGEAEQLEGLYVFVDSKPVSEYDFLGSVTAGLTLSQQYTSRRDNLVKNAKKKFPAADAIILHFNSAGTDKCDAIKFK
jgi:hypothetical protein